MISILCRMNFVAGVRKTLSKLRSGKRALKDRAGLCAVAAGELLVDRNMDVGKLAGGHAADGTTPQLVEHETPTCASEDTLQRGQRAEQTGYPLSARLCLFLDVLDGRHRLDDRRDRLGA